MKSFKVLKVITTGEAGKHWMKTEETYKAEIEGIWHQCDDDNDDEENYCNDENDDDKEDLFTEISTVSNANDNRN